MLRGSAGQIFELALLWKFLFRNVLQFYKKEMLGKLLRCYFLVAVSNTNVGPHKPRCYAQAISHSCGATFFKAPPKQHYRAMLKNWFVTVASYAHKPWTMAKPWWCGFIVYTCCKHNVCCPAMQILTKLCILVACSGVDPSCCAMAGA